MIKLLVQKVALEKYSDILSPVAPMVSATLLFHYHCSWKPLTYSKIGGSSHLLVLLKMCFVLLFPGLLSAFGDF